MRVRRLNEAKRTEIPKLSTIGDYETRYNGSTSIDEKGALATGALNLITGNESGNFIDELYGKNEYSRLVLSKFIDAFKWGEMNASNTFIRLLKNQKFRDIFKDPNAKIQYGDQGRTISPQDLFEKTYNAYCNGSLDEIKDDENLAKNVIEISTGAGSKEEYRDKVSKEFEDTFKEGDLKNFLGGLSPKTQKSMAKMLADLINNRNENNVK